MSFIYAEKGAVNVHAIILMGKQPDAVWEVSAEDNEKPAGTELMKGLTTLFDNDSTNGKYISNSTLNGTLTEGVAEGTALKYVADKDGTLTVSFIDLGTEKTVYVVAEGGKQAEPVASTENSSTTDKLSGSVTATVTAGMTYYIYGAGTKARFTAASFTAAE